MNNLPSKKEPESKESFKCMDCDYIGDKNTMQEHIIGTHMKHRMIPESKGNAYDANGRFFDLTPKSKKDWEINEVGLKVNKIYWNSKLASLEKTKLLHSLIRSEKKKGYEKGCDVKKGILKTIAEIKADGVDKRNKELTTFIEQIKWDGRLSVVQMIDNILDFINN